MTDTPEKVADLAALADHLAARRAALLRAWQEAVDHDHDLTTAASLSRSQFLDHVPAILDEYEAALRGRPDAGGTAAAHGRHRWQQGFRLREVTREWGHLHLVLLGEVERFAAAQPRHAAAMPAARRALAHLCHGGVSDSADQFFRLRQLEAAGQVHDLEAALAQWQRIERRQAEAWREAAHDLRGQLGIVRNVSFVLNQPNVADAVRDQFLAMLDRGVGSLHAMLEDVTGLARLQAGHERRQVAPLDAAAVLRGICEGHLPQARSKGLALRAEGPAPLDVEGDAVKLGRVVQNLVQNALKYTARGGVTVSWGDSRTNDPDRWMICVKDTGPGLHTGGDAPLAGALEQATHSSQEIDPAPPAPPQKAAAPPASSSGAAARHDRQPGEGIGLSIVKRLCELLDATLEMESAPGAGTTVRVVLPRRYSS